MNISRWMLKGARGKPYLHDNVPLLLEENIGDTCSVSSRLETDSADGPSYATGRNTMADLVGQKVSLEDDHDDFQDESYNEDTDEEQRAELQLNGTEEQMATLQDLSELLYTRGRLQELGCTFSEPGELLTYGGPPTLKESEQLLRLGPIYDEQWASFFRRPDAPFPDDDPSMWSDMRTLKRMLGNEGVQFGPEHQRLTWGVGGDKLVLLCAAYDDLQKLWTASLPSIRNLPPVDEREEDEHNEDIDDSGCYMDEEPTYQSMYEEPDTLLDELRTLSRQSGVPRNIGWRFSDDIDPATIARYTDSKTARDLAELEADVDAAVALSFPLKTSESGQSSSLGQVESKSPALSTTFATFLKPARLLHGPSRLQNVATHSVTQREELMANPRADGMDSLALDETLIEAMNCAPNTGKIPETQPAKKKGLKDWWKVVVGRKPNAVPGEQVPVQGDWFQKSVA